MWCEQCSVVLSNRFANSEGLPSPSSLSETSILSLNGCLRANKRPSSTLPKPVFRLPVSFFAAGFFFDLVARFGGADSASRLPVGAGLGDFRDAISLLHTKNWIRCSALELTEQSSRVQQRRPEIPL